PVDPGPPAARSECLVAVHPDYWANSGPVHLAVAPVCAGVSCLAPAEAVRDPSPTAVRRVVYPGPTADHDPFPRPGGVCLRGCLRTPSGDPDPGRAGPRDNGGGAGGLATPPKGGSGAQQAIQRDHASTPRGAGGGSRAGRRRQRSNNRSPRVAEAPG